MSAPGIERLTPVCEASGRSLQAYLNSADKDESGRAPCPVCRKPVKLIKAAGERWSNTIPHHHMGRLAGVAYVDAIDSQTIATRRVEMAAPELLEQLRIAFSLLNAHETATVWQKEAIAAAIAKATGAAS